MVMLEYLVVDEAENFSVARIAPEEIDRNAKAIDDDFKNWQEWRSLEVSRTELESALSRHLRAKEFLKFKTESMGFQVTDEEAKAYYDQNRLRFNSLPF